IFLISMNEQVIVCAGGDFRNFLAENIPIGIPSLYQEPKKQRGLPFGNPLIIWRKRRDSNSGTLSGRRFSRPKKNKEKSV
ncbi:hypothetical protein, partial [Escherichia coli]|uniref:hypothetical protein n=1 Tax=Escherichia coli TaxID=562 RepID=UPI00265C1DCD